MKDMMSRQEHDTNQPQLVETLHPSRRKGVMMRKIHYERFREYILERLNERKEIGLQELIDEAITVFPAAFGDKVSWYLLMVKLDLEARGLIRVSIETRPRRIQVLSLPRRSRRNLLYS